MNYLLPEKRVMPMHCSVNVDDNDNGAIFFGLSGTGKTTLSANLTAHSLGMMNMVGLKTACLTLKAAVTPK